MTYSELKHLVRKGEGQFLEFKRKANHPEKIVKELVSFANSKGGGTLLLGVSDNGNTPGLRYPKEEFYVMQKAIEEHCSSTLEYQCEIIATDRKKGIEMDAILAYYVPEHSKKPIFWMEKPSHKWGKAFIRINDECIQASREMRQILKLRNTVAINFKYNTLSKKIIEHFKTNTKIDLKVFSKIHKVNIREVSRTIVKLVLIKILSISPSSEGDQYFLQ